MEPEAQLPRVPADERTLPALLRRQAERHGDRVLVRTDAGRRTFAELPDVAAAVAGTLAAAGVGRGDRVAVMSDNRIELVELWLGCAWLGAVLVPINTAARGLQLSHVLRDSAPRLSIVAPDFVDGVEAARAVDRVWTFDDATAPGRPAAAATIEPGDPCVILYTSGTTGPSKGVVCPHAQWYWWGVNTGRILGVREGDVLYTSLPLFHTNALNTFVQALLAGATFVPGPRFSASGFSRRLVDSGATVTYLLGAMIHILLNRPPDERDRAHDVRIALAPATPAQAHDAFRARYGIDVVDGWGSTETNAVLATSCGPAPPGSMGGVVPGFDARIVDEHDEELPRGEPGELVVRNDEPFAFATGYFGLPEKTVEAWRNLWFHTGDRAVQDDRGFFWFVDRVKDAIRRRGENISSYEVEAVLTSHPDVVTAAAYGVPAEVGEEDVAASVVVREGATLNPAALIAFCEPQLAYFALPRYVEFVDALPLTPNGKVEKYRLRERGVVASMWDREAARPAGATP